MADFLSINAFNPYYRKEYASSLDNKIDVIQNFDVNYKFPRFVELDAKYGIDYRTENTRWTYANQSANINYQAYSTHYAGYYAPDGNGEIDNWQYNNTFQNLLASAYFRTDFQNDFHLKIPLTTSTQVAWDWRKKFYTEYDSYGVGLSTAPPINIAATQSQAIAGDYVVPFITFGYLLNQTIDFGNWGGTPAASAVTIPRHSATAQRPLPSRTSTAISCLRPSTSGTMARWQMSSLSSS